DSSLRIIGPNRTSRHRIIAPNPPTDPSLTLPRRGMTGPRRHNRTGLNRINQHRIITVRNLTIDRRRTLLRHGMTGRHPRSRTGLSQISLRRTTERNLATGRSRTLRPPGTTDRLRHNQVVLNRPPRTTVRSLRGPVLQRNAV